LRMLRKGGVVGERSCIGSGALIFICRVRCIAQKW